MKIKEKIGISLKAKFEEKNRAIKKSRFLSKWQGVADRKKTEILGVRRYENQNFHNNFVDLNPKYTLEKHNREVSRGKKIVG